MNKQGVINNIITKKQQINTKRHRLAAYKHNYNEKHKMEIMDLQVIHLRNKVPWIQKIT